MSEHAIQFYFQGEVQQVTTLAATRTVLQYLREERHQTGTKEGCAEGDCGACTVVVGELIDTDGKPGLQLRAINSCVQFLPTLDGKALFTVEDVAEAQSDAAGQLHPLQQALVEQHGSQCGFCTPGFVMSLWAMYEAHPACPSRAAITETLSGNLCRCTGYRPILDAAQAAYKAPRTALAREPIINALAQLDQLPSLNYQAAGQSFHAPKTRTELAQLRLQYPAARLLAGSTDVGLWVTKQGRSLGDVIYLGAVAALKTITLHADYLEIGAMASLTDAFLALSQLHGGWVELARRFASKPIQNAGTLGGNVANGSPIGDSMPGLIALEARLLLQRGEVTREIALDDFYLAYQKTALAEGEFVVAIRVPYPASPATTHHFSTYKIAKRNEQDISAVCAAFSVYLDIANRVQAVRIAYGGVAAIPKRAQQCEAALLGQVWAMPAIEAAMAALAQDYAPLSDGRASSAYRQRIAANLLQRFWLETQPATGARRLSDVITTVDLSPLTGA